ncbi:MAG TPA: periplasmic heavy metal sensor [Steroidobacteraceae bacterium]|nr:periplasmic heavy metal sensor [Steroidobacteraceae bacterium]
MTPFQRQLILTVLLAGIAGFVGVWVGVNRLDASLYPPAQPLRAAVDELSRRGLTGLTSQQKQQINAIDQRYAHTRTVLRARIAAANVELSNALAEEMGFGPAVEKSIDDLKTQVGELQRQTVLYVLSLRAVLTPPQQAIFDEKVVAALMTDTR